jgi:formate dehydrogenase maturation protein FdhE|tara:strand:+ start:1873 stop:2067 length:195 start_codon:yes stop_codon:yes gene_type:complete
MTVHSDAAYIKNPTFCPYCKSDDIRLAGDGLEAVWYKVYQSIRCNVCETEWHDVYELVGYEEVD